MGCAGVWWCVCVMVVLLWVRVMVVVGWLLVWFVGLVVIGWWGG